MGKSKYFNGGQCERSKCISFEVVSFAAGPSSDSQRKGQEHQSELRQLKRRRQLIDIDGQLLVRHYQSSACYCVSVHVRIKWQAWPSQRLAQHSTTAAQLLPSTEEHSNGKHVIIAARVININAIDFNSARTRQDSGSSSSSQL